MGLFDMFKKAEKKPAAAENKEQVSTPESEQEISLCDGRFLAKKEKYGYVLYSGADGRKLKIKGHYMFTGEKVHDSLSFDKVEDGGNDYLIVTEGDNKFILSPYNNSAKGEDFVMEGPFLNVRRFVPRVITLKNGETKHGYYAEAQNQLDKYWGYIDGDGKWIFDIKNVRDVD